MLQGNCVSLKIWSAFMMWGECKSFFIGEEIWLFSLLFLVCSDNYDCTEANKGNCSLETKVCECDYGYIEDNKKCVGRLYSIVHLSK